MTRHAFKMTCVSEEGLLLFTLYDRNVDVLETRVTERLGAAKITGGMVYMYKDDKRIGAGFLTCTPAW